ncbi:DNA damage-regulated autophagy modulator protein 2-like [Glandiceps talaboti]
MCCCDCRYRGGGLCFLPITLVVMSSATFITSYVIAVLRDDVVAVFPYISDTGTKPPESCIFGQFLNLSAFLAFATIYVRYKQVAEFHVGETSRLLTANKAGLIVGMLSSLGLSIVANFQETNVIIVHVIGASMVFGFGVSYTILQTGITYGMYPERNGISICRIRLFISIVSIVSMIIAMISAIFAHLEWQDHHDSHDDSQHWKPTDGGYAAHLVSTVAEWVMAFAFMFFFFTYVRDFQKVDMEAHMRLYVEHLDEIPVNEEPNERTRLIL